MKKIFFRELRFNGYSLNLVTLILRFHAIFYPSVIFNPQNTGNEKILQPRRL